MLAPVQNDRNSPGYDDGGAAVFDDEAHDDLDSRAGARGATGKARTSARIVDSVPFRAVGGNGIHGIPAVRGVDQDRFDHAITSIGAIASAGFAICHVGLDEPGFDEVANQIDGLRVVGLERGRRACRAFRPNELERLAQARSYRLCEP